MNLYGKYEILNTHKIGFLCSRITPASIITNCYDWAINQRVASNCIIAGFHSKIEYDILNYLLKGDQPLIIVLARGFKENIEPKFQRKLDNGSLLIVTPFEKSVKRITQETAYLRNRLIIELADEIALGYVSPGGQLDKLLKTTNKPILQI